MVRYLFLLTYDVGPKFYFLAFFKYRLFFTICWKKVPEKKYRGEPFTNI